MSPEEYINSIVGKPWIKGSDDPTVGLDCYGLVFDSYRRIDGINIPDLFNREECNLDLGVRMAMAKELLFECEEKEGAIWTLTNNKGCVVHIGRILCGYAVHAAGNAFGNGSVIAPKRRLAFRMFRMRGYTLDFYEVAPWLKS